MSVALEHSWPLFDSHHHFESGHILSAGIIDILSPRTVGALNVSHAGLWECDLSDNSLIWSGGVFDLFGLPRGTAVKREDALACYSEESRAKMERLRAYAIQYQRGFTLDTEIRPATGGCRRMRLIAAPACESNGSIRLHGLKLII